MELSLPLTSSLNLCPNILNTSLILKKIQLRTGQLDHSRAGKNRPCLVQSTTKRNPSEIQIGSIENKQKPWIKKKIYMNLK